MAIRRVIHKGAFTSNGGKMLEGVENFNILGEEICVIGMLASCPICKKGYGSILPIENVPIYVDNVQVALDGDIIGCGCPFGENIAMATQDAMSVILDREEVCGHAFPRYQTVEECQHFMEELRRGPKELQVNNLTPEGTPIPVTGFKPFSLTDIPTVMRDKLYWYKSAAVMEKWFSLDARKMTENEKRGNIADDFPAEYFDNQLFSWDWLVQFHRVPEALADMNQAIHNNAARGELTRIFRQQMTEHPSRYQIDNVAHLNLNTDSAGDAYRQGCIRLHRDWQFQLVYVGYEWEHMDDLYGSLGNFSIYAAVSQASIEPLGQGQYQFTISEIALYMRDTFDFLGDQYLGHWDTEGFSINVFNSALDAIPTPRWTHVPRWRPQFNQAHAFYNKDFKTFRAYNNKGGDIMLFSDIKRCPVDLKVTVSL